MIKFSGNQPNTQLYRASFFYETVGNRLTNRWYFKVVAIKHLQVHIKVCIIIVYLTVTVITEMHIHFVLSCVACD